MMGQRPSTKPPETIPGVRDVTTLLEAILHRPKDVDAYIRTLNETYERTKAAAAAYGAFEEAESMKQAAASKLEAATAALDDARMKVEDMMASAEAAVQEMRAQAQAVADQAKADAEAREKHLDDEKASFEAYKRKQQNDIDAQWNLIGQAKGEAEQMAADAKKAWDDAKKAKSEADQVRNEMKAKQKQMAELMGAS